MPEPNSGACEVTKWMLGNELSAYESNWDAIRTHVLLQACPALDAITAAYIGVSSDPNLCKVRAANAETTARQWVAYHDAVFLGTPPNLGSSQLTRGLINAIDCSAADRDEQLAQAAEAVRLQGVWLSERVNEYVSMQTTWYGITAQCPVPPPNSPPPPPPPGPPPPG